MARLRSMALLPFVALAGACWESSSPTDPGGGHVPFTSVYQDQHTGVTAGRVEIIETSADWATAWREIHANSSERPALPAVDFAQRRLLLAAAGQRPDGCYAIEVAAVARQRAALEAILVETVPGQGCFCTQAITHPVHVVSLQRSAEPITSRSERRVRNCG